MRKREPWIQTWVREPLTENVSAIEAIARNFLLCSDSGTRELQQSRVLPGLSRIWRRDSGKDLIPGKMLSVRLSAASGEVPVQQFNVANSCNMQEPPVGKRTAALTAGLVAEKTYRAALNPIIMGLRDSLFAAILKPNQAFLSDCLTDHRVNFLGFLCRHESLDHVSIQRVAGGADRKCCRRKGFLRRFELTRSVFHTRAVAASLGSRWRPRPMIPPGGLSSSVLGFRIC